MSIAKAKYIILYFIVLAGITGVVVHYKSQHATTQSTENVTTPTAEPSNSSQITIDGILSYTNQERAKNGLAPLTLNPQVTIAAQQNCSDMIKYGYYDHINPKTGKKNTQTVIDEMGGYSWVGENIAEGYFFNAGDLVNSWVSSPDHKLNIDYSSFTDVGIAMCDLPNNPHNWRYYVQDFWTAPKPRASAPVENTISGKPYSQSDPTTWPLCDPYTSYSTAYQTAYCLPN